MSSVPAWSVKVCEKESDALLHLTTRNYKLYIPRGSHGYFFTDWDSRESSELVHPSDDPDILTVTLTMPQLTYTSTYITKINA
eukprot:7862187-Karenia_brevis.AAC.1